MLFQRTQTNMLFSENTQTCGNQRNTTLLRQTTYYIILSLMIDRRPHTHNTTTTTTKTTLLKQTKYYIIWSLMRDRPHSPPKWPQLFELLHPGSLVFPNSISIFDFLAGTLRGLDPPKKMRMECLHLQTGWYRGSISRQRSNSAGFCWFQAQFVCVYFLETTYHLLDQVLDQVLDQ
jgi:hypothetical protein